MHNIDSFLVYNRKSTKYSRLREILKENDQLFEWVPGENILDAGCGPGDITIDVLLPWLPQDFRLLLGVDLSAPMINYALANYASEKITFDTKDLCKDISKVLEHKNYDNRFNKIFSFYTLHWFEDLPKGIRNLHSLLSSRGQVLFYFPIDRLFQKTFNKVQASETWSKYFKDVNRKILPFPSEEDPLQEFNRMMVDAGFEVIKSDVSIYNEGYDSIETISEKTVKDKWKKMRDSHRQAMLRRKTTTGQAASAIKRWKFEEQMQFLLKTMAHRPSDTNVPPPIHPVVAAPEATDDLENSEDDTELQIEENEFSIPASLPTQTTEKRKRPDKGADKIISFMKQKHDQKMELKQTRKAVDGVDLFLASVAQSMRKLPRRQLHKVKVAILNVIAAAEDESEWEAAASPVPTNSTSNSSASMDNAMIRPSTAGSSTSESPHLRSESLFVANNQSNTKMENSTFY